MIFKVVLIDDEQLAMSLTGDYLREFSQFEVVAKCSNGFEGIKAIQQLQPDLIFLDIQMPKINGFEMLELVEEKPKVIFTTAFDEYAIRAFETNALDYLMKPFTKERFNQAINKFLQQNLNAVNNDLTSFFPSTFDYPAVQNNRVVVKVGNDIRIIPHDEILYVEAYDDYIKINIKGDCFLKKQTMQKIESQLNADKFVRVHRSFVVNINEITKLELVGKEVYQALLRDQTRIPLSKTGYAKLKSVLGI
jgi:two-component system, LytTR family, response regulator